MGLASVQPERENGGIGDRVTGEWWNREWGMGDKGIIVSIDQRRIPFPSPTPSCFPLFPCSPVSPVPLFPRSPLSQRQSAIPTAAGPDKSRPFPTSYLAKFVPVLLDNLTHDVQARPRATFFAHRRFENSIERCGILPLRGPSRQIAHNAFPRHVPVYGSVIDRLNSHGRSS